MSKLAIAAWCLLPVAAMLFQIIWAAMSKQCSNSDRRWRTLFEISIFIIPVLNLLIVAALYE